MYIYIYACYKCAAYVYIYIYTHKYRPYINPESPIRASYPEAFWPLTNGLSTTAGLNHPPTHPTLNSNSYTLETRVLDGVISSAPAS